MIDENEFFYYLNREYEKLKIVFEKIKFKDKDIEKFVRAYYEDMKYFYNKKDYLKAFELENYIWGILDALANLNIIYVPEDIKNWFKIIK